MTKIQYFSQVTTWYVTYLYATKLYVSYSIDIEHQVGINEE